jgi:hypothetical protein
MQKMFEGARTRPMVMAVCPASSTFTQTTVPYILGTVKQLFPALLLSLTAITIMASPAPSSPNSVSAQQDATKQLLSAMHASPQAQDLVSKLSPSGVEQAQQALEAAVSVGVNALEWSKMAVNAG